MKRSRLASLAALLSLIFPVFAGETLFEAIDSGHIKTAREILKNGADVNQRMIDGVTPLHLAVRNNNIEAIDLLVSFGADLNATDSCNLTLWEEGEIFKSVAAIERLNHHSRLQGIEPQKRHSGLQSKELTRRSQPEFLNPTRFLTADPALDKISVEIDRDFCRIRLTPISTIVADVEPHTVLVEFEFAASYQIASKFQKHRVAIFDAIRKQLSQHTIQRLKEDYIDRFLHKDVINLLRTLMVIEESDKPFEIFIPVFLVN